MSARKIWRGVSGGMTWRAETYGFEGIVATELLGVVLHFQTIDTDIVVQTQHGSALIFVLSVEKLGQRLA